MPGSHILEKLRKTLKDEPKSFECAHCCMEMYWFLPATLKNYITVTMYFVMTPMQKFDWEAANIFYDKKSQKMVWELCQMLINRGWNCHSRKSERLWLLGLSFTVLRCEWPHFFSSKSRVECEFDMVSLFVLFLFNDHV